MPAQSGGNRNKSRNANGTGGKKVGGGNRIPKSRMKCKYVVIRDEHTKLFGHRFLNSQLSLCLGAVQLLVCLWALTQHIWSMASFNQILHCDFSSNSTLPPLLTHVDAIIFDIGLFHNLWGITGCVAQHLDGGYGRFCWCVAHIMCLLFCLPFAFVSRPKPQWLWPLLIQQSAYGVGMLILSLAALPRAAHLLGDLSNAPLQAIAFYSLGTLMNFFLLYIYWHWYWHVEAQWNSARKLRRGETFTGSVRGGIKAATRRCSPTDGEEQNGGKMPLLLKGITTNAGAVPISNGHIRGRGSWEKEEEERTEEKGKRKMVMMSVRLAEDGRTVTEKRAVTGKKEEEKKEEGGRGVEEGREEEYGGGGMERRNTNEQQTTTTTKCMANGRAATGERGRRVLRRERPVEVASGASMASADGSLSGASTATTTTATAAAPTQQKKPPPPAPSPAPAGADRQSEHSAVHCSLPMPPHSSDLLPHLPARVRQLRHAHHNTHQQPHSHRNHKTNSGGSSPHLVYGDADFRRDSSGGTSRRSSESTLYWEKSKDRRPSRRWSKRQRNAMRMGKAVMMMNGGLKSAEGQNNISPVWKIDKTMTCWTSSPLLLVHNGNVSSSAAAAAVAVPRRWCSPSADPVPAAPLLPRRIVPFSSHFPMKSSALLSFCPKRPLEGPNNSLPLAQKGGEASRSTAARRDSTALQQRFPFRRRSPPPPPASLPPNTSRLIIRADLGSFGLPLEHRV